jgi:hypothetical protein
MILRRENPLLRPLEGVSPGNLDFFGPKGHSFRFPGPTPSNGPRKILPASKSLSIVPYKQQVH